MPTATCHQPATASAARASRQRRPAATLLHELVRTNLETWLATAADRDEYGRGVPLHAEAALRNYLKCGILAHGFARVYCGNCRLDFLVAFSCKGRDLCPSCATRHMVDVSAYMVDQVLPRVQHRQWVLSMPKRVRWNLRHKPEVISGLLTIFLRAVATMIRQCSPGAPPGARDGAVAFVHRFGSYLNSHVHFHVLVTDGVFSAVDDGEAIFHPALDLERKDIEAVQTKMRHRGLRWLHRHGHLDDDALHIRDSSEHAGGWSVDASVTIPDWDRHGLERLARYCARPPLSQELLGRLNEQTLVYSLCRPTADGRTELQLTPIELLGLLAQLVTPPRLHKHRTCGVLAPNAALREAVTASASPAGATLQLLEQARASMGLPSVSPSESDPPSPLSNLRRAAARCWALLLVRIHECLRLRCPKCGGTDNNAQPITNLLASASARRRRGNNTLAARRDYSRDQVARHVGRHSAHVQETVHTQDQPVALDRHASGADAVENANHHHRPALRCRTSCGPIPSDAFLSTRRDFCYTRNVRVTLRTDQTADRAASDR